MVDIRDLRIGDKVKIVDDWSNSNGYNGSGRMDHWLGQVMTVRSKERGACSMMEDQNEWYDGWCWNASMIDYVIRDTEPYDIESLSGLLT